MEASALSLVSMDIDDPAVTGALLERQIDSLETSRWKEGVQSIVAYLLTDALKVYGPNMPVRRARVLLKCMDFMYHAGPEVMARVSTPEDMGNEVEKLLQREVCLSVSWDSSCFYYDQLLLEPRARRWSGHVLRAVSSYGTYMAWPPCSSAGGCAPE